jgi:hypothetical protein
MSLKRRNAGLDMAVIETEKSYHLLFLSAWLTYRNSEFETLNKNYFKYEVHHA